MKNIFSLLFALVFTTVAYANSSDSSVNLVLTQGSDRALPIAVVPFANENQDSTATSISTVVAGDLRFSGQFKVSAMNALPAQPHQLNDVNQLVWRNTGVENVVIGSVVPESNGKVKVSFILADLVKSSAPQALLQQTYEIPVSQERALAHHISDLIFKTLTGTRGIFSTRIAYVQRTNTDPTSYSLMIADADGFNPHAILTSPEPIMSPAWAPNGKQIAYVSFEGQRSQIYVANIESGARRVVSAAAGINGAPAWSPDGQKLAIALSKSGSPKIYLLNLASGQLRQLTTGSSIDTEPAFSPDGNWLVFTSDRGGSPQIYRCWLNSGKIDRLTFSGDYNARGSVSPDGKQMVMIDRTQGKYDIAVQDLADGRMQILTHSGRNDSPSWAPNGQMIIYANEYGELGLVSIDTHVRLRVPGKGGSILHPAWSPFFN